MIKDSPFELTPVRPVSPPAPYLGGKRNLAKRICARIAAVPHRTYVEPFVGMAGIFLRRDSRPPVEVINDISGDVSGLFRVLQRHHQVFIDMLRWQISRAEFDRLAREAPMTLTDLERAARFLYLQRIAFGGKVPRANLRRRSPHARAVRHHEAGRPARRHPRAAGGRRNRAPALRRPDPAL